jgi:hypothetical protein
MNIEVKEGSLYERNHNHHVIVLCEQVTEKYVRFRVLETKSSAYKIDEMISWEKQYFISLLKHKMYSLIA